MKDPGSIVSRILLCPLAAIAFLLLTSLARLLGGLIAGAHPVVNWLMPFDQPPLPVTLIAFLLLALLGWKAGLLVQGAGCTLAAVLGGYANNLPVNYSGGWPKNYPGGYLNGGMIELALGIGSILLAAAVQLLVILLCRKKRKKTASDAVKPVSLS